MDKNSIENNLFEYSINEQHDTNLWANTSQEHIRVTDGDNLLYCQTADAAKKSDINEYQEL